MNKFEKLFGTWEPKMRSFLEGDSFKRIGRNLKFESDNGGVITPLFDEMFKAFKECPYEDLSIVFLLTNPYYNGESDGIALSASHDRFKLPEVLTRVFDVIETEIKDGLYLDRNPDLSRWSKQGVLMLNCDLSTLKGKPGAHLKHWKPFIRYTLKTISEYNPGVIFVLMGKDAQMWADDIDPTTHDIIRVEHPMTAVKEKRPWDVGKEGLFKYIDRVTTLLNDRKLNWTDYDE